MDENLERVEAQEKQTPPTSEAETGKEPISQETEQPTSTAGASTFTREDIDQAVSKAKGEVQSAKDKELAELQKQLADQDLSTLEATELEAWGDTTEVKEFQAERRKFTAEKATFQQEQVASQALASQINEQAKVMAATDFISQYNLDEGAKAELLKAQNPQEMETIAVKLGYEKVKRDSQPPKKIDSSLPSATGQSWRDLSARKKIEYGLKQKKK